MDTRHVWSSDTCHDTVSEQPASLTSIRSDSGMNSMEYWDYTVELECIQGHSPTSESGEEEAQIQKQMFTRTKELEHIIKFQRETIQDQAMRIEHLCRQSSMLREMTDSRTKMCEQMEVSLTQLEEENTRLKESGISDKRRIHMLKLELEQCVQAMRDSEMKHDGYNDSSGGKNSSGVSEEENLRLREKERKAVEERELMTELAMSRMSDKMKLLEQENIEARSMMKEMEKQIDQLRYDNIPIDDVDSELVNHGEVHTLGSEPRQCSCHRHLETERQEDDDTSIKNSRNDTNEEESREHLITRLDAQYRALIDKYESLLDVYNQTRAPEAHITSREHVSLQEELGMMEISLDVVDMMNVSHDVSVHMAISGQEDNYACEYVNVDVVNEDENDVQCDVVTNNHSSYTSENCSESSGFCDNSSEEDLDTSDNLVDNNETVDMNEKSDILETVSHITKEFQTDIIASETFEETAETTSNTNETVIYVSQDCQTDIVLCQDTGQSQTQNPEYQTIFTQIFALLKSEPLP